MTEATQTIEQTYLNFPSERFPLSSLAAHDTYRTFWEKTHQIDNSEKNRQAIERWEAIAVETNRILNAFCGDGVKAVYPETYEAAVLTTLADTESMDPPDGSRNARRALKQYFKQIGSEKSPDQIEYIGGLLNDRKKIRDFWSAHAPEPVPMGQSYEWDKLPPLADLDAMLALVDDDGENQNSINVESVLIQGAQLIAELENFFATTNTADGIHDSNIIDKIHMSESLIVPMLEIMGYDGFAMRLNSITKKIRLKNIGEKGQLALDIAEKVLEKYQHEYVIEAMQRALYHLSGSTDMTTVAQDSTIDFEHARVIMTEGVCTIPVTTDTGHAAFYIMRVKTPGSLAWKLMSDHEKGKIDLFAIDQGAIDNARLPMDIIAATVIFDDNNAYNHNQTDSTTTASDGLATSFGVMVNNARNDAGIELRPSPSRDAAVHIRGTETFCNKIASEVYQRGYSKSIDIRDNEPVAGMEVAKLTFMYESLGMEIQFITETKRNAMRTEEIAHIFYKLGIADPTEEQIKAIKRINQRKDSVKSPVLVNHDQGKRYINNIKATDTFDMASFTLHMTTSQ